MYFVFEGRISGWPGWEEQGSKVGMREKNPKWQLPRWLLLQLDGWPWRMDVSREATGITASGNRPCGRRKGWDGAEKQSKRFICRLPLSSISFLLLFKVCQKLVGGAWASEGLVWLAWASEETSIHSDPEHGEVQGRLSLCENVQEFLPLQKILRFVQGTFWDLMFSKGWNSNYEILKCSLKEVLRSYSWM